MWLRVICAKCIFEVSRMEDWHDESPLKYLDSKMFAKYFTLGDRIIRATVEKCNLSDSVVNKSTYSMF